MTSNQTIAHQSNFNDELLIQEPSNETMEEPQVSESTEEISPEPQEPAEKTPSALGKELLAANLLGGGFSLCGENLPEITPEESEQITAAIHAIENRGNTCGFVILDTDTGQGLSYNAQWAGYSASIAKALLVSYLLDSVYIDGNVPDYDAEPLFDALTYSDNDSYDQLVSRYYTQAFIDWLWQFQIHHDLDDENGAYPYASACNISALWCHLTEQLKANTPAAKLVLESMSQTEVSFIRDGIGPDGWTVTNKAGWIAEYDTGVNATNDVAIIEKDGRKLVLSIISSLPYEDESARVVSELAATIVRTVS